MKRIYILCFLIFGIGIMSSAIASSKNTEVSFYLVKNKISDDDILKNNLSGVVLDKSPVFSNKDIIKYSRSEHTIKLTKEAYKNFRALRDLSHFVICVNNQPVYLGTVRHGDMEGEVYGLLATSKIDGHNEIKVEYRMFKNPEISFCFVNKKISNDDIYKNNISGIVLDESTVITVFTTKDILEYSQSEHTIKLTEEAYKNYLNLPDFRPFVICVDNKPVYLGTVWKGILGVNGTGLSAEPAFDGCNEIQFTYSRVIVEVLKDGVPLKRSMENYFIIGITHQTL